MFVICCTVKPIKHINRFSDAGYRALKPQSVTFYRLLGIYANEPETRYAMSPMCCQQG